jgi:hypothetical protein
MHIITNNGETNLKNLLTGFGDRADCIKVASAYFSETKFICDWLSKSKKVELLISLRPPTNYYSLKTVYSKLGIHIQFLGEDFHSKFFIFHDKGNPFACVIGSSNFTAGGLHRNIETNAILTDGKYLSEIEEHFNQLFDQPYLLQPTDLDN